MRREDGKKDGRRDGSNGWRHADMRSRSAFLGHYLGTRFGAGGVNSCKAVFMIFEVASFWVSVGALLPGTSPGAPQDLRRNPLPQPRRIWAGGFH